MPKNNQEPPAGQEASAQEIRQASFIPNTPQIPLVVNLVNSGDKMTRYRHMLDACMKVLDPADATLSAMVTEMMAEAAQKSKLGTLTPSQAIIGLDDTKTYLFILPAPPRTPGATPLKVKEGQITLNLYETFGANDRLVRSDVREYYDVLPTPGEVTVIGPDFGTYKGWGVYVDLSKVTREPISRLSDEEKAAETRARKAAQKKEQNQAPPEQEDQAPAAEPEQTED
jgi:hypothetical protein